MVSTFENSKNPNEKEWIAKYLNMGDLKKINLNKKSKSRKYIQYYIIYTMFKTYYIKHTYPF